VFVFIHGEWIAWVALYAVLILPALSLLYTVIAVRGITASNTVDSDHVGKNAEITYSVSFRNKGWLAVFCARVKLLKDNEVLPFETTQNEMVVSVGPWRKVDIEFSVTCLYRGIFLLQAEVIEIMDVLGLFSFKMKTEQPLEITVYPALAEIKNVPLSAVNETEAPSVREATDEDYANVTDLRKHRPEDSFKRVHWKISAKRNELMVKSFQAINLNSAVLVLNNRGLPFDRQHTDMERIAIEDKLIECVISVANYSLIRRFPVELYYMENGLKVCAENSYAGFFNMYGVCAGIKFDGPPAILQHLKDILTSREDIINLVFFTADINKALCEELRAAKVYGHNLIIIYVETRLEGSLPSLDAGLKQHLVELGVAVYYFPFDATVADVIN